jgi:hypothetical protein
MELRIEYTRNGLWCIWKLLEHHEDTNVTYLIAQGAKLRRKHAREAADTWARLYRRQRNLAYDRAA